MTIRALCFDLDGTLINSGPDIVAAANHTRRAFMVPELPYDRIIQFVGSGVRQLMQGVMMDLAEEDWEAASAHFIDTYHNAMTVKTHLYEGVLELLTASRRFPMAVCTNKPEDMTHIILKHYHIADYFQVVVGAEATFLKKPDPAGLLYICQSLGCKPEEVALIGDSVVDIDTARAAGCMAVAVTWGFQPMEVLVAAKPDVLIQNPMDLCAYWGSP